MLGNANRINYSDQHSVTLKFAYPRNDIINLETAEREAKILPFTSRTSHQLVPEKEAQISPLTSFADPTYLVPAELNIGGSADPDFGAGLGSQSMDALLPSETKLTLPVLCHSVEGMNKRGKSICYSKEEGVCVGGGGAACSPSSLAAAFVPRLCSGRGQSHRGSHAPPRRGSPHPRAAASCRRVRHGA
jgi:hypothetical protein